MKVGLFLMPISTPDCSILDAHNTTIDMIKYADQAGYAEAWVGEHYTSLWEKIPSPDILLTHAIMETKQIKLAAGSHLLPYHHPVELAHRVAYMDHLAQGRLMLGIAKGATPTDPAIFGVSGIAQQNEMSAESLAIMLKVWTEEQYDYKGKYWSSRTPDPLVNHGVHIKPFQQPHPPIGVAGSGARSDTLKLAGQYGFMPMSFAVTESVMKHQWECVTEAALANGRDEPDRNDWRVVNYVIVADTDEEALEFALGSTMGKAFDQYLLPIYREINLVDRYKLTPDMKDEEVDSEFLAKHHWMVGSPTTVAEKMIKLYKGSGGFGTLLMNVFLDPDRKEVWHKSMKLMMEQVLPIVNERIGES